MNLAIFVNTIGILFGCLLGSAYVRPERGYMFKPYVRYLLSTHIRRQYQKLYSLYLAELVVRGNPSQKEDVDELRKIASDIRDYSETLPSLKRLSALLLGVLSIIGIVFAIFDVRVSLNALFLAVLFGVLSIIGIVFAIYDAIVDAKFDMLTPDVVLSSEVLILLIILITFTIIYSGFAIALSPFIAAFYFKRFLFKDNNSKDISNFTSRGKAMATQLYNSSFYKLEDQLFELLGGKAQKPKEIPIDIIFRISSGAFLLTVNSFLIYQLSRSVVLESNVYVVISLFAMLFGFLIAIPVFLGVVNPIREYKTRVKAGLV
jgi:hypothetical protein